MQVDDDALTSFARLGLKQFWLRQIMFVGATAITTAYLSSLVPVYCYLACLCAEIAETHLARRILAETALTPQKIRGYVNVEALVGVWSALAVSTNAVIVAQLGEDQFLFVPLIYMFAAALYATMFNHQVREVLYPRLAIYVLGFLVLTGAEVVLAAPDERFLPLVQLFTVVSASLFIVMNAIEFRKSYSARREREREAVSREARLRMEMEVRRNAEIARHNSDTRFHSLFENAPIPIREEDLSGMKRMIDALQIEDPEEFSAYLDAHPEFLEACSKEIVVVDANQASLEQHGYADKSEMLAKVVRALSPAAMKIVRMTVEALHEGAGRRSYETRITRADGQIRTVAATWSVIPGHEDTYARILLSSLDLTDWLASEAALRQAQKMEAVGQLTGGVAHDFNNLLTVVHGNLDLLEVKVDVDPELSDPIRKAVQRGAELTQRLLAFSRKQPLSARSIDLSDLIAGMTDLLRRSLGEEIAITIDIPSDLWNGYADSGQVEAALLNLALNARDAMPEGGRLTISCHNASIVPQNDLEVETGDYVVLAVSDSGCGMAPDVASKAFDPFFTTKEVGKGSGLGLSMVYGFAKQSEGAAQIESRPGKGTTVSLYLPRAETHQVSSEKPPAVPREPRGQGEAVLILEDDDGVRSYLSKLIDASGYKALPARDAFAAREILGRGEKIDLLISDIMLPGGVKGTQFAAEMLAYFPGTPLIFVSGRPSEIEHATTLNVRNAVVLAKPFTRGEILETVVQALGD